MKRGRSSGKMLPDGLHETGGGVGLYLDGGGQMVLLERLAGRRADANDLAVSPRDRGSVRRWRRHFSLSK